MRKSASTLRFGGGPNRLRDSNRLEVAKRRLREGWTLSSVATTVGYTTAAAFSDAFKSLVGMRPGAWAKQAKTQLVAGEESAA